MPEQAGIMCTFFQKRKKRIGYRRERAGETGGERVQGKVHGGRKRRAGRFHDVNISTSVLFLEGVDELRSIRIRQSPDFKKTLEHGEKKLDSPGEIPIINNQYFTKRLGVVTSRHRLYLYLRYTILRSAQGWRRQDCLVAVLTERLKSLLPFRDLLIVEGGIGKGL